jgi:hypothetical protein
MARARGGRELLLACEISVKFFNEIENGCKSKFNISKTAKTKLNDHQSNL